MAFLNKGKNSKRDLNELIGVYTKQWKWFVISTLISLVLAFIYLRYTTPEYAASAKIQVIEEKGSGTGIDLFQELNIATGSKNQVEDEMQIINSRSNFIEIAKELGLNTVVKIKGNIMDTELYRKPPININFLAADSIINKSEFNFFINLSSSTTFGFKENIGDPIKVHSFGKNLRTPVGDLVITPSVINLEQYEGETLEVQVQPLTVVAEKYQKKIRLSTPDKFSNIVNLRLEDPVRAKATDILNRLIFTYNENAVEDKKTIADRTSDFINDRIADISTNLSSVDQSAQDLKTSRGLTDIASEANINLNVGAANRQELANYETQLNIAASMQDILNEQDGFEVLPGNIGLNDPTIASTTERYNQLVLERQRLLKSSTEKSPIIQNLDQQLRGLKQSMESSLGSTVNNLGMQVNTLRGQQSIINSKIYSAPRNERALRDITRQQQTTESLYLYLLQKREEAQIAFASASPRSKIVDSAYLISPDPVSPKTNIVLLASIILGFAIPFSVFYLRDLLDNKVHNKTGLEKMVQNIPVLAELPKLGKNEEKLVKEDDRSVLAESLRILRTNLDYLMKSKNQERGNNNVIFVSSSVPGEGKTFVSSNLSMILSSANKNVLLIGADIRNPKIYTFFPRYAVGEKNGEGSVKGKNKGKGLSDYLFDPSISLDSIINRLNIRTNKIDVIYSGRIPPNPSELLMSDRMEQLFEQVSELYDYVIVDTAPLMVVADTLLISQYSSLLIYVTKAGVTPTNVLNYPIGLQKEGKLKGLTFVVNSVSQYNLGYGGKYGYGYSKTHKKWWKFS